MTKKEFIDKITNNLSWYDVLDKDNYNDFSEQLNDVKFVLNKALEGYVIIKGDVINND